VSAARIVRSSFMAPAVVERVRMRALAVGLVGALALAAGGVMDREQFLRSYLFAYLWVLGIALGSLALLMLQFLSGGFWGLVIRRIFEAATRTLPLLALLFLPILMGVRVLFPWAQPEVVAADPLLQHKAGYLNVTFWTIRVVVYFAAWTGIALLLNRWSLAHDEGEPREPEFRFQKVSGPGLVLYGFTATFASIDWMMSLDPHWFSTIFGVMFMGGQALSAMSFAIAAGVLLSAHRPLNEVFRPRHLHDMGKLLLAFVMLWAYFAFSQFLIIWSANLPEEIPWYLHRLSGGYQILALLLVIFHFAVPFALLLSRDLKRHGRRLALVATGLLLVRLLDLYWVIAPNFGHGAESHFRLHWMDIAAPLALERPLVPLADARLPEALEDEHEH
jgi:predicted small integral membrane protein